MLKRKKNNYVKELIERLDKIISMLEQNHDEGNKMQWLLLEQGKK